MKKYILLLFIIHYSLAIFSQKKVYVRMIDTSGWGNNFADTASINALSLSLYDRLADTSAAVRSALVDTASAVRSYVNASNFYLADGTIDDAVRNVTLGSNDINFDDNTLYIDGSANRIGINTTAPSHELNVTESGGTAYIQLELTGTTSSAGFRLTNNGGRSYEIQSISSTAGVAWSRNAFTIYDRGRSDYVIVIDSTGNVGFGIGATPSVKLDVNGQIRARTWSGSNSTTVCRDANGVLVPCTSDGRLKRNISPIDSTQALDKVLDLIPVSYRWKAENIRDNIDTVAIQSAKAMIDSLKMIEASDTTGEIRQQIKDQREILRQARKDINDRRDAVTRYNYGFIAQQVRDVDEILSGTTDDGYLTVHNDQITSLLVGAIKAQEARIKSQEMIIADLIARVTALEDK